MNHKRKIAQGTYIFLFITIISVFFCCTPEEPAEIASTLAKEWTLKNVDSVSRSIAGLVANSNPLIETAITMVIAKEINQRITWQYSQPEKLAEERYRVVITASSKMEIPLLGSYKVSVNYNLEIDTRSRQVTSANIDAGSFAMGRQ